MAIDFNKQLVFDPKIEIVGEEIPLAAMEKTGAVLQDRYDKSYENYTKFQELAKQIEQIANPEEREKAKEWIKSLEPEIQDIAKKGDFHNMRWQTMALANNAANNLALFGERSKTIQANMNAIAAAKDIKDPIARKYYQNLIREDIAKTKYNPETKTFDFQPINMPNLVGDFDYTKLSFDAASGWKPTSTGFSNDKIQVVTKTQYDKNGNILKVPGVYNVKTGQQVVGVEKEEVVNSLKEILAGSPGALEAIDRDVDIFMKDNPKANREQVYQEIYSNKVLKPINAAAEKESFENKNDIYGEEYANEGTQKGFGFGNAPTVAKPFYVQLQSDVVSGETNATVQNFIEKPLSQIFYEVPLLESKGPFGSVDDNYGEILKEAKPELLFLSQSYKNYADKLKTSKDPNDKKLYNEIVASGALSIYDSLSKNQSPKKEFVINFQNKLKSGVLNNVPVPSAYKSVSASDNNWQQTELNRRYPDKIGNPVGQLEDLNAEILGSKDGIDITKGEQYKTLQGFDLFDPLTGQYNTASAALEGKGDGLKINKPKYGETYMKITGKVVPGTVLNATSKTPYGDLSHMGDGYTVSISGKDYIISNRNLRGSLNSRLNDLASFGRIMREETTYPTYDVKGKPITVKVRSDNTKVYVNNGKQEIPISFELYNYALESARQQGIDPVQYLTTLTK